MEAAVIFILLQPPLLLFGSKNPVAGVSQAGDDVGVLVELFVYGR